MKLKKIFLFVVLLTMVLCFNSYAMPKNQYAGEPERKTPSKDADYVYGYRWTWANDELCVQFQSGGPVISYIDREALLKGYEIGIMRPWRAAEESKENKKRETYSGSWSQNEEGIWSFVFDDNTIPISVTKIDGVLYAFNGYGELRDGYNYYGDFRTAADGIVTNQDPSFLEWMAGEYVPECTSHE